MRNLFAALKVQPSMEAACSTYDDVLCEILKIYQSVSGEQGTSETCVTCLNDKLPLFYEQIAGVFNMEIPVDIRENLMFIKDVANYICEHDGSTVTARLNNCTWDHAKFVEAQNKMTNTLKMIDSMESNEALGSGLLRLFIGIADTFISIGNTFKTNIFKFYKDLKRSEIRFYTESNLLKVKACEAVQFTKIMNLKVPVPTGMVGTYLNAANVIKDSYVQLDIEQYAELLYTELQDIRRQMSRSEQQYKQGFSKTHNIIKQRGSFLQKIINKQAATFKDVASSADVQFKKVYNNVTELKQVRQVLTDMEQYLGRTQHLVGLIDDIDVILGDLTTYLTEDSEVDQQFVRQLAACVRYIASMFDVYGQTSIRQMALQHNHILVYENIYAAN